MKGSKESKPRRPSSSLSTFLVFVSFVVLGAIGYFYVHLMNMEMKQAEQHAQLRTELLLIKNQKRVDFKTMMKANPDFISDAIQANPMKFIEAYNHAMKAAQTGEAMRREDDEKKNLEESIKNPLMANIRPDESFRGNKNAPITLIEYSDFECPFCSRGYSAVTELLKKYEGKIRFVYKHLPLNFHPKAIPAAKYFEAIRLQDEEKAWKFHDAIYENQRKLQDGESFLKSLAKDLKVNMQKLEKDVKSVAVQQRIDEDMKEAAKLGFQGTPGFLLNGIAVKGAYPTSHFEKLIEELKKHGKLKL